MERKINISLKKLLLIVFTFLHLSFIGYGQNKYEGLKDNVLKKKLKIADQLFEEHSYYNAIEYYRPLIKAASQNEYVLYKLGLTYFKARDYKNAEIYLQKLADEKKEKMLYPLALFHLGETLKMNGKYDEAKKAFLIYLRSKGKAKEDKFFKSITKNEISSCDFAKSLIGFDTINYIKVNELSGEANNPYSDFSPFSISEDTLLFASLRSDSVIEVAYGSEEAYPVRLFQSTKDQENNWTKPEEFKPYTYTYDHTANGIYSPDKKHFYFTRCRPNKKHEIICSIYLSDLKEGKWSKAKKMSGGINKKGFTSTQPSLGVIDKVVAKKKKEYPVLYFVSNRPGGRGNLDIWYSLFNDKGTFTKPVNCGTKINTVRDEITPFYDKGRKTLFFSSNYHWNAGGFDVFKTEGNLNRWSKPVNLGMSVNSSYDDTYYVSPSLKEGFIVSNRPGGKALKSETCCDDIYRVQQIVPPVQMVRGIIKPENQSKNKKLSNVKVGILPSQRVTNPLQWHYSIVGLKDSIQWINETDSLSNFIIETAKSKNYSLIVVKDSFDIKSLPLDSVLSLSINKNDPIIGLLPDVKDTSRTMVFKDNTTNPVVKKSPLSEENELKTLTSAKMELSIGDVFILDNMYFDTDKDLIKNEALPALQLLLKFLNNYPKAIVEIAGHTDSHASEEHNMDLSQRRANRIREYVIKKGIDKNRLSSKGYGEGYPIAANENEDGSDNPEGRKRNRRTEVRILGEIE